mgnify:CR=1 FL=1
MDYKIIYLSVIISGLSFLSCKNAALGMIARTGTNNALYPKYYILVKKWMKRIFRIKEKRIPIHLYFELIMAVIFALLGPIEIITYIASKFDRYIIGMFLLIHLGLVLVTVVISSTVSCIFKFNNH